MVSNLRGGDSKSSCINFPGQNLVQSGPYKLKHLFSFAEETVAMANMVFVGVKVAAVSLPPLPITNNALTFDSTQKRHFLPLNCSQTNNRTTSFSSSFSISSSPLTNKGGCSVLPCLPPASSESSTSSFSTAKPSTPFPSTKLYVSG